MYWGCGGKGNFEHFFFNQLVWAVVQQEKKTIPMVFIKNYFSDTATHAESLSGPKKWREQLFTLSLSSTLESAKTTLTRNILTGQDLQKGFVKKEYTHPTKLKKFPKRLKRGYVCIYLMLSWGNGNNSDLGLVPRVFLDITTKETKC